MIYAAFEDLTDRFGETELAQVADMHGTGEAWQTTVDRALSDAAAEINAAVIGRYALPIDPPQDILTRIACDLARESLYSDAPPENVIERAKVARKLLEQIAAGKLLLGAAKVEAAASLSGLVEIVTGRRKSPFGG
jgi:phage gp36-like protein